MYKCYRDRDRSQQQLQQYEKRLNEIANQVQVLKNINMITLLFAPKCI